MIRILVLDDDGEMLDLLYDLLVTVLSEELDKPYEILKGTSGLAGLKVLEGAPPLPDLILADINMPEMSGLELLTRVRANPDWQHIPFIFVSGSEPDKTTATRQGSTKFLLKPFRPAKVIETISQLLSDN